MATIPRLGGTVGARLAAMTTSGRTTPALRRLRATVSVVLLLVGVASACSGGGSEEGSARGGNPTDSAATPSSSATPTGTPSTGCGTLPATESVEAPPGDAVVTLGDRSYRLGIPADYDRDRPVPLVMNLHGSGSNALEQTTYSEMAARAGERGWITVTPDAIGGKWELAPTGADDEFLTAVFDQVTAGYCVDLDRVHLTGMSLGAWKAAATACAHADRFASIALVTVEVHPSDCPPMSVVAFHGTADTVVPYGEHARAIGEQFFSILGTIAAADPAELPLGRVSERPAPEACWKIALDHWAAVIEADEQHPQPIVWAAIRALRRRPPPPAQAIRVVHGDYRTGNFLHDGAGKILAILDWEMVHLGDPLEDLGWALDPLWGHFEADKVAGMLPRDEALAVWRRTSGLEVDEAALAWWSLFNAVKGQAIWTSAAKEYRDGGFKDPVLAISGWYTARRHDEILAAALMRWETLS